MGASFPELRADHIEMIGRQHLFFVATAPLAGGGHVNLSPKGYDTFTVIDPRTVAYLDLTGSGAETAAHVNEPDNGRITIMFISFEERPLILRLYGTGTVVLPSDERYGPLVEQIGDRPGARAVILVDVTSVSGSCGYAVPLMDFVGDRPRLADWADSKTPDDLVAYRALKNATSKDGLPTTLAPSSVRAEASS